jgi:hypothetical protein
LEIACSPHRRCARVVLALGLRQAGLRGADLGLGTLDFGGVRRRVDRDQQVALA